MTGLQMLLKSMGVQVDPAEIQQIIEQAKIAIPAIVRTVSDMAARQQRIEEKLDVIIARGGDLFAVTENCKVSRPLEEINGR